MSFKTHLLNYINRMAENKPYFSPTTYTIVYNLIKNDKIKIKHTFEGNPLKWKDKDSVVGGLNYSTGEIELDVRIDLSLARLISRTENIESNTPQFNSMVRKIFAIILSEGIFLYNKQSNGSLIETKLITKWYLIYFLNATQKLIEQSSMAKKLAEAVAQTYAKIVYNIFEVPVMNDESPDISIDYGKGDAESEYEGLPTIAKGSRLHFSKAVKKIFNTEINKLTSDYNLSMETEESLRSFASAFSLFVTFIFNNRYSKLTPDNLAESPTTKVFDLENINRNAAIASRLMNIKKGNKGSKESGKFMKFVYNRMNEKDKEKAKGRAESSVHSLTLARDDAQDRVKAMQAEIASLEATKNSMFGKSRPGHSRNDIEVARARAQIQLAYADMTQREFSWANHTSQDYIDQMNADKETIKNAQEVLKKAKQPEEVFDANYKANFDELQNAAKEIKLINQDLKNMVPCPRRTNLLLRLDREKIKAASAINKNKRLYSKFNQDYNNMKDVFTQGEIGSTDFKLSKAQKDLTQLQYRVDAAERARKTAVEMAKSMGITINDDDINKKRGSLLHKASRFLGSAIVDYEDSRGIKIPETKRREAIEKSRANMTAAEADLTSARENVASAQTAFDTAQLELNNCKNNPNSTKADKERTEAAFAAAQSNLNTMQKNLDTTTQRYNIATNIFKRDELKLNQLLDPKKYPKDPSVFSRTINAPIVKNMMSNFEKGAERGYKLADDALPSTWEVFKGIMGFSWGKASYVWNFIKSLINVDSNIEKLKFGYGGIAEKKIFSLAYKAIGVDDVYESEGANNDINFNRKTFTYNELYMPSAILSKIVISEFMYKSDFSPLLLKLVDYSTKGLKSLNASSSSDTE